MIKNTMRSDGRYQSRVYLGDGKYKFVLAYTQKDLERKVQDVKLRMGKGIDVTAEYDTFGDWAQQWLELKEIEVSYGRWVAYRDGLRLLDDINGMSLARMKPLDLQKVFTRLHKDGYALATIKNARCACKQVFDFAIANRVTDFNPCLAVRLPKETAEPSRRALTDEEIGWITAPTDHRGQRAAMIMLYAGLRRGELVVLMWKDVDLVNRTITVCRSAEKDGKGQFVVKKGAKTRAGERVVDIPQILVDYLAACEHTSDYVCPAVSGKPMSETAWKKLWDSYLNELNFRFGEFPFEKPKSRFAPKKLPFVIPRITAHWLRHTFITMMYQAGVDVLTAKEQAGHADISTTLAIYTHLDKTYKRHQMNKLDDYIAEHKKAP